MPQPRGFIGRIEGKRLPVLADFNNCIDMGLIIRFEEVLQLRKKLSRVM